MTIGTGSGGSSTPTLSESTDFNITRNDLVAMAFKEVNLLELDGVLDAERLAWGVIRLNIILRRLDAEKKHIWTICTTPSALPLVANTFSYTTANGLPSTIKRLVAVNYRNDQGKDTPLEIWTPDVYARIADKFETGTPRGIVLSENISIGLQTLIVHPTLPTVNTQSEVTGTDALNYRCIRSHTSTADASKKPITGADYLLYWEVGGSSGSAWAAATDYTAPQQLLFWFERALYDFDSSTDNPDVPQEWIEYLLYEMVEAVVNSGAFSTDDRIFYARKAEGSRKKIIQGQTHYSNDLYNKTTFF